MGAALKKLWNRIFDFTSSPIQLSAPKFASAEMATIKLEESYKTILNQLNKTEDDMISYIPSRRVWDEGGYEGGSNLYEYGRPAFRWAGDIEDRIAAPDEHAAVPIITARLYIPISGWFIRFFFECLHPKRSNARSSRAIARRF